MKMVTFVVLVMLGFILAGAITKPKIGDADKDGIPDVIDEDIDGDGVPNLVETQHGTDPFNSMHYLIEDTFIGGG